MKTALFPVLAAALLLCPNAARATTTYALTNGGQILTFDHLTPGTITNTVTPDAAVVGAYILLAIDIRPTVQTPASANPGVGTLWAIGNDGTNFQLFVIDPATGATTAVGAPIAAGIDSSPGVNTWGFDFDPATDRIRLVNSSTTGPIGNNYRLNPNTGALTFTDTSLAFEAGDPNAGSSPQVDAAAYTTATFGGGTALYFIDPNLDAFLLAPNPNGGTVRTVGSLGVNIDEPNGFDIYRSLALFSVPTLTGSSLYSVNLTTGAAALVGNFPASTNLRGLAISISDPVPPAPIDTKPALRVFGKSRRTVHGTPALVRGRATDESGVVALSYRQVRASGSYRSVPPANPFSIKVRRLRFGTNPVIVRATDPTGNVSQKRIVIIRKH